MTHFVDWMPTAQICRFSTFWTFGRRRWEKKNAGNLPPLFYHSYLPIMGRKAATLKSKSIVAIQFPHDGPIYNRLTTTIILDETTDDDDEDEDDIRIALDLLASLKTKDDEDDSFPNSDDPSWKLTRNLCQALQSAGGIKEQLQALQSYRSTILNWKQPPKTEGSSVSSSSSSHIVVFDEVLASGLYRLFLEWSLSAQTPLPLQRVLHATLQTLDPPRKMENICTLVLKSIWVQDNNDDSSLWKDPLHSIDVAVNAPFLSSLLQTALFDDCISFIYRRWAEPLLPQLLQTPEGSGGQADAATQGLFLAKMLKILLNGLQTDQIIPFCNDLEALVSRLMKCPTMPTEGFNTLGIVFAKLHLQGKSNSTLQQSVSRAAILAVQHLDEDTSTTGTSSTPPLSGLARLSIVQGIAATLDLKRLLCVVSKQEEGESSSSSSTPLEECWKYSLHGSQVATDSMDRWAALKGLSTLASRWMQYQQQQQQQQQHQGEEGENTINEESFSSTHVHSERFNALIQETLEVVLQAWENPPLRKLGTAIPGIFQTLVQLLPPLKRQELCRTVLDQPLNRKGRYLALEILLPYFSSDNNDSSLIRADSLLEGVGDRGPNSGAIADLWIKLLGYSWNQNDEKLKPSRSFSEWTSQWVPSLSRALVEGDLSRRKQVAAFSIVRLLDWMKRTKSLQAHLSESVVLLFTNIGRLASGETASVVPVSVESVTDRVLWAHLELARQLHVQKVMTPAVQEVIVTHVPSIRLQLALTNESSWIRLAAFRSLQAVVADAYNEGILEEAELWKNTIPFSIKTIDSKEYTTDILHCLISFLDRFSTWEAGVAIETEANIPLQNFYLFASDFVIGRLVLKLGAYPGTVVDKEEFSVMLVENLLAFVLQDQSFSTDNVTRNGIMFQRKRQKTEQVTMSALLRSIIQRETFAALFSLLHSPWDGTRAIAFRLLEKLVVAAHLHNLPLPEAYSDETGLRQLKFRGLYLASSPRQREADTGSRFLAFIFISKKSGKERLQYLSELVHYLETRLSEMKLCLQSILQGESSALDTGGRIPLAHGIINAILLTVHHQKLLVKTQNKVDVVDQARNRLYEKLIGLFCEAIQLSLNIVADVRDGERMEGVEETLFGYEEQQDRSSATPLNVNTGAIGANGNLSKLAHCDNEAQENKLAVQRVVVSDTLSKPKTCLLETHHLYVDPY
jgi:hypothetical protein